MSPQSVQKTMPSFVNLRPSILQNYCRFYELISISSIRNNKANWESLEVAALSIKPFQEKSVYGCLFEIPEEELGPYLEREHRYKPGTNSTYNSDVRLYYLKNSTILFKNVKL